MRKRPNQEIPNQTLKSQTSSKYCDNINNLIELKHIIVNDVAWLGYSWSYYNKVIHKKCYLPSL